MQKVFAMFQLGFANLWRGNLEEADGRLKGALPLVTAEMVFPEVERALRDKFCMPSDLVAIDLALLRRHPVHPTSPAPKSSPIPDEDDARILATALAAGADVLVTGDRDFLDVRDRIAVERDLQESSRKTSSLLRNPAASA